MLVLGSVNKNSLLTKYNCPTLSLNPSQPFWSPNPTFQRQFHILPVSALLPYWLGTLAGSTNRFQRAACKACGMNGLKSVSTASKSNMTTCCWSRGTPPWWLTWTNIMKSLYIQLMRIFFSEVNTLSRYSAVQCCTLQPFYPANVRFDATLSSWPAGESRGQGHCNSFHQCCSEVSRFQSI